MWIKRTFEQTLGHPEAGLRLFPIWLVLGSRQVGKSAVFKHLAEQQTPARQYIDLDDLATRTRAIADPVLFAREITVPVTIDEIQYAPQLLSRLKQLADTQNLPPGSIWLTGSQSFEVMRGVRESLAGRVAVLNLFGLSDQEKAADVDTPQAFFQHLAQTSFPKLYGIEDPQARALYLSSYVKTYIERDVRELLGIQKRREFELFVKLAALRTGQQINYADLGRDAGISAVTAKEWAGLLEDSFLIALVQPYAANRGKRLTKAPKLYFLDAGLAAYLAGWRDAPTMRLSPMAGALFETHMHAQILRWYRHRAREVEINFYRTRDGVEIDFLVDDGHTIHPIEAKMGSPDPRRLPLLSALAEARWRDHGTVLTLAHTGAHMPRIKQDWRIALPDARAWS